MHVLTESKQCRHLGGGSLRSPSSTSLLPERIDWIIAVVVFFAWTARKFGVTGTDSPPSTICSANGATSGSLSARTSSSSDLLPGK